MTSFTGGWRAGCAAAAVVATVMVVVRPAVAMAPTVVDTAAAFVVPAVEAAPGVAAMPVCAVDRGALPPDTVTGGADYYAIPLVTTRNLPGTGYAEGTVAVAHAPSPFTVTLGEGGSYRQALTITLRRMKAPRSGVLVAWVATRELDVVERLGALGPDFTASGEVAWNRFIVVVSHEAEDDPEQERWAGPIALRGMSRSGMMHTMAGHGPFQQENCAAYGYD